MNKTVFGILTLIFNNIGVPCFLQGNVKGGILRIVLNFVTCGIIGFINFIMGIILAIEIFNMTDEEFEEKKAAGALTKGIPA
ncbi:MAG: hypothetical protein J6C27_07095 [Clostridia bacterium]|nr:hypothetical protein [Clostridia bacterium]